MASKTSFISNKVGKLMDCRAQIIGSINSGCYLLRTFVVVACCFLVVLLADIVALVCRILVVRLQLLNDGIISCVTIK